jgi:hypothetical protein
LEKSIFTTKLFLFAPQFANQNHNNRQTMDSTNDGDMEPQEDEDQEQINNTILEFLATFHSISTEPQNIADLTDGVALFEALSEMYVNLLCHVQSCR